MFDGASLQSGETYELSEANLIMQPAYNYDYLGHSITGADLNGDGADELILAANLLVFAHSNMRADWARSPEGKVIAFATDASLWGVRRVLRHSGRRDC